MEEQPKPAAPEIGTIVLSDKSVRLLLVAAIGVFMGVTYGAFRSAQARRKRCVTLVLGQEALIEERKVKLVAADRSEKEWRFELEFDGDVDDYVIITFHDSEPKLANLAINNTKYIVS